MNIKTSGDLPDCFALCDKLACQSSLIRVQLPGSAEAYSSLTCIAETHLRVSSFRTFVWVCKSRCAPRSVPVHLLPFDQAPTHNLVDLRFDEGGADRFALQIALAVVRGSTSETIKKLGAGYPIHRCDDFRDEWEGWPVRYRVKVEWKSEAGGESAEIGEVEASACLSADDVGLKLVSAKELMA